MISRSPILRLLILAWWLAWTIVIAPAHTRGIISLNACPNCETSSASFANTPLLFGTLPSCDKCRHTPADSKPPKPTRSPSSCAICQIIAHTTPPEPPPALDCTPELILILPLTPAHQFPAPTPFRAYLSRAPPTA